MWWRYEPVTSSNRASRAAQLLQCLGYGLDGPGFKPWQRQRLVSSPTSTAILGSTGYPISCVPSVRSSAHSPPFGAEAKYKWRWRYMQERSYISAPPYVLIVRNATPLPHEQKCEVVAQHQRRVALSPVTESSTASYPN